MRSLIGGIRNRASGPPVTYAPARAATFSTGLHAGAAGNGAPNTAHLGAMAQVGTLSAIVGRTSEAVSQVSWRLYRKAKPGQPQESRTEVTRHAALDLWAQPNPFMPRQEFVETVQQHYELTGEQWWLVSKAGKLPLELWPIRPDRMRPVPHSTEFLAGAIYRSPDGDEVPLGNDETIFVRRPNPLDIYRGLGVVQSILVDLDSARFTAEWNRNFFLNSAEPGGIIQVDKRLSDDEFTEMVMRWREQHQGVAQAHRVAVLEQGQWIDRKFSMRDMQFPELRSLTSEMIREGFGFPKPLLGTVTDVNRANSEAAEVMFGRWLVVPRLERLKGALNGDLLPMYGSTARDLEFDYDNPVPADVESETKQLTARTQAYALLTGTARVTPESAAQVCGLPPMEHVIPAAAADPAGDQAPGVVTPKGGALKGRDVVEAIQKVYLGVGTMITSDEARGIVNEYGADLTVPGPAFDEVRGDPTPDRDQDPAPVLPGQEDRQDDGPPAQDDARAADALRRAVAAEVRALAGHTHARPDDAVPPPPAPAPPTDGTPATLPDGAGPDPQPVQDQWEEAVAALIVLWLLFAGGDDDSRAASRWGIAGISGDLIEQVRDAVTARDLTALARLTIDAGLLEDAAAALGDELAAFGEAAAQHVVAEAALQGVALSAGAVDRAALRATGQVAAATLADGLRITAAREAARVWGPGVTADTVAVHVADALTTLTPAQPALVLGGAATAAEAAGREASILAGPSAAIYAREVNDRNRCGPCSVVDGKWVGNSDDPAMPWRSLYPVRGYLGCLGRDRCRGGLVAIWRGGKDWTKWVENEPVERGGA